MYQVHNHMLYVFYYVCAREIEPIVSSIYDFIFFCIHIIVFSHMSVYLCAQVVDSLLLHYPVHSFISFNIVHVLILGIKR